MNLVVRKEKKARRALRDLPRAGTFIGSAGNAAQTCLLDQSEQQIIEMERTFTDRWEW